MTRCFIPWFWPLRKPILFDSERCEVVFHDETARHAEGPHRSTEKATLYLSPHKRWFVVLETYDRIRVEWLFRWEARFWLHRHHAPLEVITRYFPGSVKEA